jgi:hypothetical protein
MNACTINVPITDVVCFWSDLSPAGSHDLLP